jgi:hypothetical protein
MRAVAAAALLALAWPAAARAADLGGGTPPTSVRGYRGQLTLVSLRAVGGAVFVRALVAARCGVGAAKGRVTMAADGSFSLAATKRDRAPEEAGLRRVARVTVRGRMLGAVAAGTASTRITLRRGAHVADRCGTGARTWQARTPAAEAVAGPARPSRGYFGLTSQTRRPHALLLGVDAVARRVQAAAFDYAVDCGGRLRERQDITPGGAIGPNGGFSLAERFTLRFADAIERYRVKVDGRFTPNGVAGTLSVTSVARSRGGAVIERCRTGSVSFMGAL